MPKRKKVFLFCFKQISKCDQCFYIHFSRDRKNIVFRSVTLGIKKLWAILDFFTETGLLTALYPTLCIKKKIYKKSFKFLFYNFTAYQLSKVLKFKTIYLQLFNFT